ncbi:MAG: glycoside hydrolase family 13 protein [Mycobacterium leprae]
MLQAALFHACRKPWVYPIGAAHLRVVLKAARGDLEAATCVYGDRYDWPTDLDQAEPMQYLGEDGLHEYWGVTLPAPSRRLRYLLCAQGKDGSYAWVTECGIFPRRPPNMYFQYAYIHQGDAFSQPAWIREAVLYQIFPDRFCNGDQRNDPEGCMPWGQLPDRQSMAGGDLAGIRQKLEYLKGLGVNCLYATPLFQSPSNHKYDTTDYYRIDPSFGTNDEFKALVTEAHQQGMRFLLDAVFNHCGKDWFAFVDVIRKGRRSKYKEWFYHLHAFPVKPSACNYETFANGVASMPKLNTANPELAEYLLQVAEYWINEADIDGWRLDVANEVDHGFWRAFRRRVKAAKPDAFILGEIWHDPTEWLQGDQYDSVMNYPWRDATLAFLGGQLDAREYDQALTRLRFAQTAEVTRGLVNLLGSHDTPRVRTVLGSREKAAQAAVLLLTAEGVPMIYYGDEVGLEGGPDPDCRRCYPWDDPTQQDQPMLAIYRRLIAIRRTFPWLSDGARESVTADPVTGLLGFRRTPTPLTVTGPAHGNPTIHVLINTAGRPLSVKLPANEMVVDLLAGHFIAGKLSGHTLALPAHGAAILAPIPLAVQLEE